MSSLDLKNSSIVNSNLDLYLSEEPLIVMNANAEIIHYNDSFKYSSLFDILTNENEKSVSELKENLKLFSFSSFNTSLLNFVCLSKELNKSKEYIVNITRIQLKNEDLFLLRFLDPIKLLERENRIASITTALEFLKIPILITSSDGNIIYLSEEFEKDFEITIESYHSKFFCFALEKFLSKEELLTLENAFYNGQKWNKTIEILSSTGNKLYKEIKFLPAARIVNGEKLSFVIVYDITNHIEQKIEAETSARKIKMILDSVSDPIFLVKAKTNYLSLEIANKCFYETFKYDTNYSLKNIEKIVNKDLFNILSNTIEQIKETTNLSSIFDYNYNDQFFKGRIFKFNLTGVNQIYLVTLQNITSEIEYQNKIKLAFKKETELNRLKSLFIENISHEIRTPFHAISGYSEIIDESLKNEDYGTLKEITSLMKEVLGRITHLFENIIELSQLESKELILEYENINPNKVIKSVYDNLVRRAIDKGIQLLLDLGNFEKQIRIDKQKLWKIIYSLVENSIKYTHYGNVVVRTYFQDGKIFIAITDTGEGMNQEQIKELLQPFNQEEDTFTRRYQGMGLGLTIAYRLTKIMGGEFDIVSQKSVGTKVILSFVSINY
jgi:signal transduction histidine kinase